MVANLPIRTTQVDITTVVKYLASKPTGASLTEAKKVLDSKFLDGRKIAALKIWGLVSEDQGRYKLTERGRNVAKNGEMGLKAACRQIIKEIEPYKTLIERVSHNKESAISSTEVGAYWHDHYKNITSESDKVINDQAVCFFQLLEGAQYGSIKVGRKGSPTRIEFNLSSLDFIEEESVNELDVPANIENSITNVIAQPLSDVAQDLPNKNVTTINTRVFISHGKNKSILNHLKEIVTFGKFTPVVSVEQESTSIPVPEKVFNDMRSCFAGVIHVTAEGEYLDSNGNKICKLNDNVLIEIGAAKALYGENIILLVEDGIDLPSNLKGLYECRYVGSALDGSATMKVLKAFNGFHIRN